jgi:iron complex outermembrane receptor protein
VSIDYKLRDGLLTYATFAKGYKPGGYNVNEVTELATQGYNAENVDTYEIGAKTEWLGNRLQFNAAGFFNDYTDQQVGIQRVDPLTGVTLSAIANAGKVEIKGLEFEAVWRATQQITVSGSYCLDRCRIQRVRDRYGRVRAAASRVRQCHRRLLRQPPCRRRRRTR